MKNTLMDLNNHLFAQMERLSDEELKGEELKDELSRANMVTSVAKEIISNAGIILQAKKYSTEYLTEVPKLLEG